MRSLPIFSSTFINILMKCSSSLFLYSLLSLSSSVILSRILLWRSSRLLAYWRLDFLVRSIKQKLSSFSINNFIQLLYQTQNYCVYKWYCIWLPSDLQILFQFITIIIEPKMQSDTPHEQNAVSAQQLNRIEQQPVTERLQKHQNEQNTVYRRERHKEPIRINADDQSQCKILLYIVAIIFTIIFFIIISAYALPEATKTMDTKQSLVGSNLQTCPGFVELANLQTRYLGCFNKTTFLPGTSNSMGIFVKTFSNLNQVMLFYIDLSPYAAQKKIKYANFNQNITFTVYSAQFIPKVRRIKVIDKLHSNNLTVNANMETLATAKYFLGYQSKIASGQQYYVEVRFNNGSMITSSSSFFLKVNTVRENFTIYTILIRVFFFILSLFVFTKYTRNCLKISRKRISIQQKGVQIIGALTLLFNDQFYFITVLWPNPFSSFLSAFFIWSYLFGLFVLCCCFLLRIINKEQDTDTIQLKKPWRIVFFSFFYMTGLTVCAGLGIIQTGQHPMVTISDINYTWFRVYQWFLEFCMIMAFFYLFYLYVLSCWHKNSRPYRQSAFLYISLFYIVVILTVTLMGSFQVFNFSAGLIFFAFGFNNSYSYFLMYLYSPSKQNSQNYAPRDCQLRETDYMKQAKTIDIQLSGIEQEEQNIENYMDFDFQSSKNSEKDQEKQKETKQRAKLQVPRAQDLSVEIKENILQNEYHGHEKSKCKSQISVEQCQGQDL